MEGDPQASSATTPGIPDHRIRDLGTFQQVTGEPRQVAGLYFYKLLDCLVDLAYKISCDFFARPHLYTQLESTILVAPAQSPAQSTTLSEILARLHARYGSNERIPSKEQRNEIYVPIFNQAEDYTTNGGDFPRLRDELVNAAAAFAERVFDTGVEMLRERVRTTHRPFKEYLVGLQGDSVRWSKEEALFGLTENISYTILRSSGIAAVFGISLVPRNEWPYFEDSNADKLIEETSKQLKQLKSDQSAVTLTREYISNLQRVALRGAEALATIIDFDERSSDADLNLLITKCYTWGSALLSLKGRGAQPQPAASPLTTPAVSQPVSMAYRR